MKFVINKLPRIYKNNSELRHTPSFCPRTSPTPDETPTGNETPGSPSISLYFFYGN
ncbi:MAG: hypothetical protein LBQ31_01300 [Bacteroidales bacterium]|nr:hypothetical protein [Bacteroidales bacterium]